MNAIRVLLWKEWREQRLTLLLVALVVVCAAVGAWRMKHSDLTMWTGFCAAAIGLVLGAAAAEAQVPTLAFLRANPVPLHVVWWVKCAFGIVSVGVMSLATAALFWLVGRGIKLISPDWVWLEMPIVSLFCYVLAQYFGGWAKSPITAIGLSLLLGVSLMVLAGVNPMGLYLPPVVGPFLALGLFVGLLWLGGTAFMRAGRSERGFSKRQALAWFFLPVALFGVLPLALGVITLVVDDWRLDPSDVRELKLIGVRPQPKSLLVGCRAAERYCTGPCEWWWWRFPSLISVPLGDGQPRHILRHGLPRSYGQTETPLSPDGSKIVVALRPPFSGFHPEWLDWGYGPTAILDLTTGVSRTFLAPGSWCTRVRWLSDTQFACHFFTTDPPTHGWGTGDARMSQFTSSLNPCGLTSRDAWCVGFVPDPVRLVLAERPRSSPGDGARLYLLRVDGGDGERLALRDGYYCNAVCPQAPFALLRPFQHRKEHPPLLLDLGTGKDINLERLIGCVPEVGWASTTVSFSADSPWLFVLQDKPGARSSATWHAVHLPTLEVFEHPPPCDGRHSISRTSDWCAQGNPDSPGDLIALPLRDPDLSKRFVITRAESSGSYSRPDDFMWLSDHEIVLCVTVLGAAKSSAFRPPSRARAGVFIADVRARTVRPLWPADGLGIQWRVMTWTEWQRKRPGVVE